MKVGISQGTMSVLAGCHSPIHSIVVWAAWVKIYHRQPKLWQIVCIFLHDIGHWGKQYLDNVSEKEAHGELGAKVAHKLFGQKGFDLINGHNTYRGQSRSMLFEPDKYSWIIAPYWWMYSNTFFEPKLIRKGSTRRESVLMFKSAMADNAKTGYQERGHDIYLKQWGRNDG
jgi:hypothetical protein